MTQEQGYGFPKSKLSPIPMEERLILSALFMGDMTGSCCHQMMNKLSYSLSFFGIFIFFVFFIFKA